MKITKKEVAQLIQVERSDTLWTHFVCFLSKNSHVNGMQSEREVRLWKRNNWTLNLYAVFIFTFNQDHHLIDIRTKPNAFGKVMFAGIFLAIGIFCAYELFFFYENERFWLYTALVVIFLTIFVVVCNNIYQGEKRIQREKNFKILDIKEDEEAKIRKASLASMLLRIFTYPTGMVALYATIFYFIPEQKYALGIGGMIIVSAYFISDLMLLFKKKK